MKASPHCSSRVGIRTAVGVSSYQAYDSDVSGAVPAFVVQRSDYDRIAHLVSRNVPVALRLSLQSRYLPDDGIGYNVVAELRIARLRAVALR
jgi:hypothetical protein